MVVAIDVTTASRTSVVALYITFISSLPRIPLFLGISKCRKIFSTSTIPMSTITPMAMAIPDNATILASTPKKCIKIKVISTPNGNNPATITEARRFNTNTIITMILIRISCERADSRVPMVSFINPVRS